MLCVLFVPVVCAERGCDDAVIIIKISVCIVFIAVAYCDGRFDLAAVYDDRGAAFKPSFGWVENPVFAGDLESCERLSVGADSLTYSTKSDRISRLDQTLWIISVILSYIAIT